MATANPKLIFDLRKTVAKLKKGAPYQWGHMGACNCGNLAQEIIQISKAEIHRLAMQRSGDWSEQLVDYCPSSGMPMDLMITKLLDAGLDRDDLIHLEKLSDPKILALIPKDRRDKMKKNSLSDLIIYLETWTQLLENQWAASQAISIFDKEEKINVSEVLS
ncbi:hypothetical protein SAMN04488057_11527 [Cyclobacterium lianum]|uniref:Uncharacterized protein n=1 Tax=Cyclobacterium lianum TaxID=388280 RepID=A0A1M7Q894_9BACT|nr:hypothetical protein [Cyclobacterium lianum]SHN26745.1 hypothetical protein SAMN04488057_11527 [Cyclobacterium lianum]